MKISIHDYENNRVICARVPEYLTNVSDQADEIGPAILTALGLSLGSCDYMMGDFYEVWADHNADTSRPNERGIELLTQDFKANALEALADLTA